MQTVTTEWLQSTETPRDVPVAQLHWGIDNSEFSMMEEEAFLFKQGENKD